MCYTPGITLHCIYTIVRVASISILLCFRCMLLFAAGILGGLTLESVQVWSRLWSAESGISLERLDVFAFLSTAYSAGVLFLPWMTVPLPSWLPLTLRQFWMCVALGTLAGGCGLLALSLPCSAKMLAGIGVCWLGQMFYDTLIVMHQKTALPESWRGIPESVCFNGYRVGMTLAVSQGLLLTHQQWLWSQLYGGLSLLLYAIVALLLIYSILSRTPRHVSLHSPHCLSLYHTFCPAFYALWKRPDFYYFLGMLALYRGAESIFSPNRELFFVMHGVSKTAHAAMNIASFWWSTLSIMAAGVCAVRFGVLSVLRWGLLGYGVSLVFLFANHLAGGAYCEWQTLYILEQSVLNFAITGFFSFQTAYISTRYALSQTAYCMAFMNLSMQLLGARSGWLYHVFGWKGVFATSFFMIITASLILHYHCPTRHAKGDLPSC